MKIYLVAQSVGEYSDRTETVISAHRFEEKAKQVVKIQSEKVRLARIFSAEMNKLLPWRQAYTAINDYRKVNDVTDENSETYWLSEIELED
jgi:hypothetical protein